jgi:hypothetical protein
MTDDLVDYDPQDYPEAVTWAKERAKEMRRQSEQITILNTTNANLHSHIAELVAELSAKSQSESALTDELAALKDAGRTWVQYCDCPGVEIEPGITSGCNAADTESSDCPTCGPFREARP